MRRRLAEIGSSLDEVARVRAELGYPIMVTPFGHMVVGQALAGVSVAQRYGNVSDQVIRSVLGRFARPTAPVDDDVRERILDHARARRHVVTELPDFRLERR